MRYVEYKGGHDDAAAYAAARGRVREGKKKKKRGLQEWVWGIKSCAQT